MDNTTRDRSYASTEAPQQDRQMREFDNLVESQHLQMAAMTGVMRRVEDLADRLLGSLPTEAGGTEKPQPIRSGWFGGLIDSHEMRDQIIARTTEALIRIERVA